MRKRSAVVATFLFVTFFMSVVSAAQFDFNFAQSTIARAIDIALGMLSPFLEKIIGDVSSSDFFFHKILILVLLVIIIKNVLDRTPLGDGNKRVSLLLAVIISTLSIRFINENSFFEAIFIQYGVLGIAITTILPMVIFFYFVHNTKVGTYGRKVFWTLYAVMLTGIWIMKSSEIPTVANWIYGITLTAAVIFIFFDKSIHSYFGLVDLKKFQKKSSREGILRAKERIKKLDDRLAAGIITHYEYRQGINEEERIIRELSKEA